MPPLAFKMHLFPGHAAEYQRRPDELWPELKLLLTGSGISDYSIFLTEETNILIGVLKAEDPAVLDDLPKRPVMQRWWEHMKDTMATNADASPVSVPFPSAVTAGRLSVGRPVSFPNALAYALFPEPGTPKSRTPRGLTDLPD